MAKNTQKQNTLFFIHFNERIEELVNDKYVRFIDISNNLKITNNLDDLFCDEMHKTLLGNRVVGDILYKHIND